ncbi:MAG TPA: HypC/HybG/HupF family hydrogenase formation chaperone [Firmicutes bacterium]|nr:MAG: HypC/HybG/HupF family hydrogenase formation chaperone [Candidatus Omnitrophota bacterium]HDD64782.1 HypC/HybG/HupF family hydrogenase formation chaperone [Bacillota bacterium]
MCLAIPMKVIEIEGKEAIVEMGNIRKRVNIQLVDDLKVGEYVIVHAGFAIQKIDEKQAKENIEIFKMIKDEIY